MTREEIESVYSRDVLDRNWWGNHICNFRPAILLYA